MPLDLTRIENTTDVHCDGDFLPHMPEVSGRVALAQRLLRRLSTRQGALPYWADQKSLDLRDYLLSAHPPERISREVSAVCLDDEQVEQGSTEASVLGQQVTTELQIVDAAGPFRLTLTASDAAVNLVRLQQES
jgi:hypothetical protein